MILVQLPILVNGQNDIGLSAKIDEWLKQYWFQCQHPYQVLVWIVGAELVFGW